MKHNILIVDDDMTIREALKDILETRENMSVESTSSGGEALLFMDQSFYDLVLLDIKLPDQDGMEILKNIRERFPETEVIMMTGFGTVNSAISALRIGAFDYVTKPFQMDEILHLVENALLKQGLVKENRRLREEISDLGGPIRVIGHSKKIEEVISVLKRIKDLDTTVSFTGESGTGKEVLARFLHQISNRRSKPFISVHCGAVPEHLLEDELFGHVKGAFTDAISPRAGVFETANGGFLFLDEIGTMRSDLQVKLLRVVQEREFRPIGSSQSKRVDVRILSATNSDLKKEVKEGRFRDDLYYRLNVIEVNIPPLRERREDILPLTTHFIRKICDKMGLAEMKLSREAVKKILEYPWIGNVRELENAIERAIALSNDSKIINADELPSICLGEAETSSIGMRGALSYLPLIGLEDVMKKIEKDCIVQILKECFGIKTKAAAMLKIKRTTLLEKMRRLNIPQKTGKPVL